jgi:Response regulator of the LytR/AlgR family
MNIAFCDDDLSYVSIFDDYVYQSGRFTSQLDYYKYISGIDFLKDFYKKGPHYFDVIFLDIEMEGANGIEIAREIRKQNDNVIIIYITSHTEFVFDSFEVAPLRFLVKPIDFLQFKEVLLLAYNKIRNDQKFIYITVDRNTLRLFYNEIYYIESHKRLLFFSTIDKTYKSYGKLEDYISKLYQNDFICVHKSFLVNYNHVTEFGGNCLKLSNDIVIPISKNKKQYAKEEQVKFILRGYK